MIEYKLKVVREAVGQNKAQVVSDIFNAVMVNITETLETARVALREAIELGVDLKNSDQLLITHLTSTGEVDILKFMKEYMRTHNIVEQEIASAEKIVELYIKTESKVLENHMVTIVEEEEEECEKKKKFCYLYLISFEKGPETLLNGYIALAEAAPSSVSSSSVLVSDSTSSQEQEGASTTNNISSSSSSSVVLVSASTSSQEQEGASTTNDISSSSALVSDSTSSQEQEGASTTNDISSSSSSSVVLVSASTSSQEQEGASTTNDISSSSSSSVVLVSASTSSQEQEGASTTNDISSSSSSSVVLVSASTSAQVQEAASTTINISSSTSISSSSAEASLHRISVVNSNNESDHENDTVVFGINQAKEVIKELSAVKVGAVKVIKVGLASVNFEENTEHKVYDEAVMKYLEQRYLPISLTGIIGIKVS
jgi:hypothetical protein